MMWTAHQKKMGHKEWWASLSVHKTSTPFSVNHLLLSASLLGIWLVNSDATCQEHGSTKTYVYCNHCHPRHLISDVSIWDQSLVNQSFGQSFIDGLEMTVPDLSRSFEEKLEGKPWRTHTWHGAVMTPLGVLILCVPGRIPWYSAIVTPLGVLIALCVLLDVIHLPNFTLWQINNKCCYLCIP